MLPFRVQTLRISKEYFSSIMHGQVVMIPPEMNARDFYLTVENWEFPRLYFEDLLSFNIEIVTLYFIKNLKVVNQ